MLIKVSIFILLFAITSSNGVQVQVEELMIGTPYISATNDTLEYLFYFNMTELNLMSEDSLISQNKPISQDTMSTLKITATIEEDVSSPVMFSIRYNYITTSWNLPYSTSPGSNTYEKWLCPLQHVDATREVQVSVSTTSTIPRNFTLLVEKVENFLVPLNDLTYVDYVSSSSPVFYYIDVADALDPDQTNILEVKVNSADDICAVVSVQPFQCPIFEEVGGLNSKPNVTWQTMLKSSAFMINKKDYRAGFFLVLKVIEEEGTCKNLKRIGTNQSPTEARRLKKSFSFKVTNNISRRTIKNEVMGTAALFFVMSLIVLCITVFYRVYRAKEYGERGESKTFIGQKNKEWINTISGESDDYEIQAQHFNEDGEEVTEVDSRRNKEANKSAVFVSELAVKSLDKIPMEKAKSMFQSSDMYVWLVLVMGVFYSIPALQLVLNYQEESEETGNQDLCYYNFQCSIPFGTLTDFNHFFSNIGYVGFGLIFLILTKYKSWRYHSQDGFDVIRTESGEQKVNKGIPHHFGIFYAMGFALIFEGILSACYHVCPTQENFQFDTTFMYVMAMIMFVKIFQFRHPDLTANAYKLFFVVAMIMFLEVIGIFFGNVFFWIIVLSGYGIGIVMLSFIFYFSHEIDEQDDGKRNIWKLNLKSVLRAIRLLWNAITCRDTKPWKDNFLSSKVLLIVILQVFNLGFLLWGALVQPGISSYLLYIFVANLMIYTIYYGSMKIYHKEKVTFPPIIYALLAMLFWLPGLYFFSNPPNSFDGTPAQSRNYNKECDILDFYDYHDIWHFLSAAGMFFCFMLLLTLDEGLADVETQSILIF